MKKMIFFIGVLLLVSSKSSAQLEKGAQLSGIQLNLLVNDMYSTRLVFRSNPVENDYGISIAPMFSFAVERNWLLGSQATLGIEHSKNTGGTISTTQTTTDLGLSAFTRVYLDISTNQKWKIFGIAALELNTATEKMSYSTGAAFPANSYATTTGSLGGGFAYFGRKICIDLNMSNTALRFGIYRIFPGRKK